MEYSCQRTARPLSQNLQEGIPQEECDMVAEHVDGKYGTLLPDVSFQRTSRSSLEGLEDLTLNVAGNIIRTIRICLWYKPPKIRAGEATGAKPLFGYQ